MPTTDLTEDKRSWTHRRLLKNVPMPRLYGDAVKQVDIVLKSIKDFRSPGDARKHLQLTYSGTSRHARAQLWYGLGFWLKAYDDAHPLERAQRGHALGLLDIDRDIVWAIVDDWAERGTGKGKGRSMGAGRVANCLAHIRAVLYILRLDVDDIVPSNGDVLRRMGLKARKYDPRRDRSLEGAAHIEFPELFARAWAIDRVVAVVFMLCWTFGFRLEEAYKWRAREDIVMGIEHAMIMVRRGPKGGRWREFILKMGVWERKAVFFAKMLSSRGTGGIMGDEIKEERQFRNRVYRVARKIGLTKRQLGATPHSLRHSFAQRRFVEGVIEVLGYLPEDGRIPAEVDDVVAPGVSRELGHNRGVITRTYTGPKGRPYCLGQVRRIPGVPAAASAPPAVGPAAPGHS